MPEPLKDLSGKHRPSHPQGGCCPKGRRCPRLAIATSPLPALRVGATNSPCSNSCPNLSYKLRFVVLSDRKERRTSLTYPSPELMLAGALCHLAFIHGLSSGAFNGKFTKSSHPTARRLLRFARRDSLIGGYQITSSSPFVPIHIHSRPFA